MRWYKLCSFTLPDVSIDQASDALLEEAIDKLERGMMNFRGDLRPENCREQLKIEQEIRAMGLR